MKLTANNEQVQALIYGGAAGDAYGAPFEFTFKRGGFTPRWTSSEETGGGLIGLAPIGTWTDDTSMTIATIASIADNNGNVSMTDLHEKYSNWVFKGEYTINGRSDDCGMTTMKALRQGYGCMEEHDNGNGSLMRISPMALTDATDAEISSISAVTHANETSLNSCIQWVHVIRELLKGAWIDDAIISSDDYMRENGYNLPSTRLPGIWTLEESSIKSSGYVVDSLEAAAWALSTSSSYEETVNKAVALGGDTDTIACIAGSAAGAYYGIGGDKGIPEKYVKELKGLNLINNAISQLESLI